jgi:hypothetical protein
MAEGTLITIGILLLRFLVPITILRWPFWGISASIIADTIDNSVLNANGFSSVGWGEYQRVDKFLDLYYLSFAVYVSSALKEYWPRKIFLGLFIWRFAGVVLFEFSGERSFLFLSPNIFELFFIAIYGAKRFFPRVSLDRKEVWLPLLFLAATIKVPQEYVMHHLEFPWGLGNFGEGFRELFNIKR